MVSEIAGNKKFVILIIIKLIFLLIHVPISEQVGDGTLCNTGCSFSSKVQVVESGF